VWVGDCFVFEQNGSCPHCRLLKHNVDYLDSRSGRTSNHRVPRHSHGLDGAEKVDKRLLALWLNGTKRKVGDSIDYCSLTKERFNNLSAIGQENKGRFGVELREVPRSSKVAGGRGKGKGPPPTKYFRKELNRYNLRFAIVSDSQDAGAAGPKVG